MSVKITFDFPNLAEVVKKNRQEIDVFIAAQMQFNRGMLFDREGAYNGHSKWAPLKWRKGQILSKRGNLRRSMAPTASNGKAGTGGIVIIGAGIVTIGSKLIYASMMNFGTTNMAGGVLKPKNAKALKIPMKGKGFIFRKSVKIPERRFDEWTKQDQQELSIALRNKIAQVINRDE